MTFLFVGSSLPFNSGLEEIRDSDKVLHGAVYAVLAGLFCRSLAGSGAGRAAMAVGFLLAVLYGASDEYHQTMVPSRSGSVADWLADSVGAVLGAAVWWGWHRYGKRKWPKR